MASSQLGNAFDGVSVPYASASSSKQPWDVFINHYGKDVKHTFAANICDTLCHTGLRVFLDKEALEAGDVIPTKIQEAMLNASVHIAIFSPDYARSPWCLAELCFMLKTEAKIIPVFYHVDPSDLRWMAKENGNYASAFSEHEEKRRYSPGMLKEWKEALAEVSTHFGPEVKNNYDEGKVLKDIEKQVFKAMKKVRFEVAQHPVGLDCMVQELWERCTQSDSNVQIVGIVGVEGVGKTTLAKELYNQKYFSFRDTSFIFNVRDAASRRIIHKKQKKLLMDIGFKKEDSFFDNIEEGKAILGSRLKSLSVLIVLDDVSHGDELDALMPKSARDQLGCRSLIIVTSRESGVLTKWGISSNAIYKMRPLSQSNAEQLLCQHAFLEPHPKEGYEDLVREYLIECRGLPLSLKKRGEDIYKKSMDDIEWERKLPPHYHKILSRAVPHKRYWFKEDIYEALCNSIQIEEGKQSIWLDQSTGKIGLKTSARSLTIEHGDDDRYWQWVSTDESRFGHVKKLIEVWFFHVYHRFECTLLSPNTEYTVAFVVKIDQSRVHSHQSPFEFCLQTIEGNLIQSARFLDDLEKSVESHGEFSMTPLIIAEDGWMEVVVGEFFLKENDGSRQARVVDVFMKNQNCNFPKSGIFLDGLKITPKTINKSGEQVYKKSMDESAAHMGNDCPTSKVAKIANSYASASDIKWETKLPPNYHKIFSRAVIQKDYSSMEEIYFALCNSIEVEKGKQIVWLDKSTGKIGLKASASSIVTTHCNDIEKWRWVPTEESSFGQVKELVEEWYSKVYARIECTLLSPNTEYTVALVVKIDKSRMHSQKSPFEFSLKTIEGNLIQSARFLDDLEKPVESHGVFNKTPLKYAENGWMEFVVGEFFLKEDDVSGRAKVIDVLMKNENSNFRKSGIFLDGVKITPK